MSIYKTLYETARRLRLTAPVDDEFPIIMGQLDQCIKRISDLPEMPKIICLCGSTRFKDHFELYSKRLALKGFIVLSVGFFGHVDGEPTDKEKSALDELHLRKIDLADGILVLNVNGYIGPSTQNEISYARETGKTVTFIGQDIV